MADVKFIVEKLVQPPFNHAGLTLVSFSEKKPHQLLELLGGVFAVVSPTSVRNRDLSKEAPEQCAQRCIAFAQSVKYQHGMDPIDFRAAVAEGEPDAIYPLLKWTLVNLAALEKRAFVGYYLSEVQVPQELFSDQEILDLHQQQKELQAEFVEVHKAVDQLRASSKDPARVRERIAGLEEEREQLQAKIQSVRAKVQKAASPEQLEEFGPLAAQLRAEQDKEIEQHQAMRKEKDKLESASVKLQKAQDRLRDMRASAADGSPAAVVQSLAEETRSNRQAVQEKLPKLIETKRARIEAIEQILRQPVQSDSELEQRNAANQQLEGEVRALTQRLEEHQAMLDQDNMLRQQSQVAKSVARKKEDILAKVERLVDRSKGLTEELEEKAAQVNEGRSKVLKGEDWNKKYNSVKEKLVQYKKKKKVLDEINGELVVLARTEAILQAQDSQVSAHVGAQEKQRGVEGFQETQNTLEEVSMAQGVINEAKGEALEEISHFVREINQQIKERKGQLAPQIKELRSVRAKFQDVETSHSEKKKVYDQHAQGYENKRSALTQEVRGYRTSCSNDESRYHFLNCMSGIIDNAIKRVTNNKDASQLKDRISRKVAEDEELSAELKARQKFVKESVEPKMGQMDLLQDLKRLMTVKLQCSGTNYSGAIGREAVIGGANVMTF